MPLYKAHSVISRPFCCWQPVDGYCPTCLGPVPPPWACHCYFRRMPMIPPAARWRSQDDFAATEDDTQSFVSQRAPVSTVSEGGCRLPLQRLGQLLRVNELRRYDLALLERAILDCYGRFLINLPPTLMNDHVHLHFQVQEAHWWYEDFWHDSHPNELPNLSLKNFGLLLWETFPTLQQFIPEHRRGKIMKDWIKYCRTIPLRGAIILNQDLTKCLMVQGWKGGRWTFPRGKVDEQESDEACAAREVMEEIGLDIMPYIHPEMFMERSVGKQVVKLYIVPGIDEEASVSFGPQKRKEIAEIRWIALSSLKTTVHRGSPRTAKGRLKLGRSASKLTLTARPKFTHVAPFVRGLLNWVRLLEAQAADNWLEGVSSRELSELQYLHRPAPRPPTPADAVSSNNEEGSASEELVETEKQLLARLMESIAPERAAVKHVGVETMSASSRRKRLWSRTQPLPPAETRLSKSVAPADGDCGPTPVSSVPSEEKKIKRILQRKM